MNKEYVVIQLLLYQVLIGYRCMSQSYFSTLFVVFFSFFGTDLKIDNDIPLTSFNE